LKGKARIGFELSKEWQKKAKLLNILEESFYVIPVKELHKKSDVLILNELITLKNIYV
jgi:hypothetical protein